MVVDASPVFTYRGYHLAKSILEHCGGGETAVCVFVTPGVPDATRTVFSALGCNVAEVAPFGDGKYCNKLSQLSKLALEEFDLAVLLDTDMVFIEDIRPYLRTDALQAKPVDLPYPSLNALKEVGRLAGLAGLPGTTSTDSGEGETFLGNCNGGFYAIPRHLFPVIASEWPKWTTWLFEHLDPLRQEGKEIHVDQVSMWLTIQMNNLPFAPAPSNVNYYVHFKGSHRLRLPNAPICILHYHDKLNVLGLIDSSFVVDKDEVEGVAKANGQIGKNFDSAMFWDFRYYRWPELGSGIGSRGESIRYKRDVLKREGIERAKSVLDVGCGDLEVLQPLRLRGYVGLDRSAEAVARASQLRPDWNFRLMTSGEAEVDPAEFVLCFEVLIHQPTAEDYHGLIDFLSRKTKGKLIVSGYDSAAGAGNNHMLFYHEPLRVSLERTGRFRSIERIGSHTSVGIYRCLAHAPSLPVGTRTRSIRGTGILICGMHRSGTSALGGALDACGIRLREDMPADHFNPKGYFEKCEVVNLHETFLREFELSGVSVKPLPANWEAGETAEWARSQIGELVERDFGDAALWAVKDPRLCRLVPLWTKALPGVPLCAILAVRHPLEVAGSLTYLSGYSQDRGMYFWLRFVLEAERNTRGLKRTVVRYDDLLASPESVMQRIAEDLQLNWPNAPEVRSEKLKSWIDVNLNRNASARRSLPISDQDRLARLCLEVHDLFRSGPADPNQDRLDAIWQEMPALDVFDGPASLYFQKGTSLAALSLTTTYLPDVWHKIGAVDDGWRMRALGDVNGDGIPDLVFQNGTLLGALILDPSRYPCAWVGLGSVDAGWELRGATNITGDGNLDLIFQKGTQVGYLEINASGQPMSWTGIGAMGAGWELRAVASRDGTDQPDLIFQNGTLLGALKINTSGAPTAWIGIGEMGAGWTLASAVDVTGDGQPDLIFQNGTSLGALRVNTSFQPVAWHEIGAMGSGWTLPGDY